jgi:predicted HicB family RNase H-like nuclease
MVLKAGKPTTLKTQKELAIEAVQQVDDTPVQKVKTQRFNVDIPDSLHKEMKIQAAKEGIKLNALAIRIFEEYLSEVSKD